MAYLPGYAEEDNSSCSHKGNKHHQIDFTNLEIENLNVNLTYQLGLYLIILIIF